MADGTASGSIIGNFTMAGMKYRSTRGNSPAVNFQEAVLTGLARDGGLFLPEIIPDVSTRLTEWRHLPYAELAFQIMRLYADLPEAALRALVAKGLEHFRHPEVTPVVAHGDHFFLELFHGPTLAFKDVALQFLGGLFEYFLQRSGDQITILGATSGDTGSAAIQGVRGRRGMRIFILYPHGRVSPLQERQMTTVPDANVHAIAIQGSFDDCQNIVKEIFNDLNFRDQHGLAAVNSINWARLLAQIVYYFYAAFRVMDLSRQARVRFTVPTGNFGDVFAGYCARRMGLPISRLILATNENDILTRYFQTGEYRRGQLRQTLSPSMDIQVASNFERYLFYLSGENTARLRAWMEHFQKTGTLRPEAEQARAYQVDISAASADTAACLAAIRECYQTHGYLLDPHTAVGYHVSQSFMHPREPMICLATAHPAKFGDAIMQAVGSAMARHDILDALADLPERRTILPASVMAVRQFVEEQPDVA